MTYLRDEKKRERVGKILNEFEWMNDKNTKRYGKGAKIIKYKKLWSAVTIHVLKEHSIYDNNKQVCGIGLVLKCEEWILYIFYLRHEQWDCSYPFYATTYMSMDRYDQSSGNNIFHILYLQVGIEWEQQWLANKVLFCVLSYCGFIPEN